MTEPNACCERGCFDRERPPHCCLKCNQMTYIHYEGCDCIAIMFFIGPLHMISFLYTMCCWSPTLKSKTGVAMIGAPVAPVMGQPPMMPMQQPMQMQPQYR